MDELQQHDILKKYFPSCLDEIMEQGDVRLEIANMAIVLRLAEINGYKEGIKELGDVVSRIIKRR